MTKEDALKKLKELREEVYNDDGTEYTNLECRNLLAMYDMAIKALEERKTGKWFDTANVYDKRAQRHDYFCLECKTNAMDFIGGSEDWWCCKPPKYCPNCGAKMEGAEE